MKTILSWSRRNYMARLGIFLIAAALVAGTASCGAGGCGAGQYELLAASSGGGYVTAPGQGTFCYDEGTVVPLEATPGVGNQFDYWSGDVSAIADVNAATTTIIMNGDYFITANFLFGSGEEEEEEGIDMNDAISIVVDDILPDILDDLEGAPYQCIRLDSSLPAGTTIEEASGNTVRLTLDEEKFFFYLDLEPGAMYVHDVKYILVDKSGEAEIYDAEWWVLIDDEIPEELLPDIPHEDDVIAGDWPFGPIQGEDPFYDIPDYLTLFPPDPDCEGFLIVLGTLETQKNYCPNEQSYYDAMYFFEQYAEAMTRECSEVRGLHPPYETGISVISSPVLNEIKKMADDGFDPVTIFIIGHGGVDGVNCGGQTIYAKQIHDTLALYPGTRFNFILFSCRSGSFVDDLDDLDNVLIVSTAVGDDECACGFDVDDYVGHGGEQFLQDYNPDDRGVEWISSLLEAMSAILGDQSQVADLCVHSREHNVPMITLLIDAGSCGAIGHYADGGLTTDLDVSHRMEWEWYPPRPHNPEMYCNFFPVCRWYDGP